MEYRITDYQPEKLFHFFEEISAIPRGSGNEKGISDYLVKFAEDRNLWVHRDEANNVIIKKAASEGAKSQEPVMLQGHIDMVCEKRAGVEHDFEKDGLGLQIKDGNLTANGTTLGADNGVAVALMLMIMDDEDISHPALECVFTTEEEVGLDGAKALDKSLLDAKIMINLDSETEGLATVSCAGGLRIKLEREIKREAAEGTLLSVKMEGLSGGHSGQDIDKERQNADILMARLLRQLMKETDGKLVQFAGGTKDNAIPRECEAVLIYTDEEEAEKAEELACDLAGVYAEELEQAEPAFECEITSETNKTAEAIPEEAAKAMINAICLVPNGVQKRDMQMDGFVIVSSNLGIVRTDEEKLTMIISPRSSVASLQEYSKERFNILAETFGFTVEYSGEYPGWSYKVDSRIREVCKESYKELFGEDLKIEGIHAGLECGLFSDAIEGLDAIAIGPTIHNCHTPDEYLPLDSFERFYEFLKDILKRLA